MENNEKDLKTCVYCGCEIPEDDGYYVDNKGDVYCDDCGCKHLNYCDCCEDYYRTDSTHFHEVEGEIWCEDCTDSHAYKCDHCGDYSKENYGDSRATLCEYCRDNYYTECADCGDLIHNSYICYSEQNGEYYCEYCYPDHSETINDYGYEMSLQFHKTDAEPEKPLYLGFELEVGGASSYDIEDIAQTIKGYDKYENYFTLKKDGSIPDSGFELVTQPMTLAYHRQHGWADILSDMSKEGLKSHDLGEEACGLHIHASRNYLTQNQWIIVDWFVSKYQSKWETIARRKECHWAKFKKQEDVRPVAEKYGKTNYDRYHAVNFENRNTVEFRLFRGTLKYETLLATLELVDALINWVKTIKPHELLKGDIFKKYTRYIMDNEYQAAVIYLKSKELM